MQRAFMEEREKTQNEHTKITKGPYENLKDRLTTKLHKPSQSTEKECCFHEANVISLAEPTETVLSQ